MFITLTAAYRSEAQPDFEGMGIEPTPQDFEEVEWDELTIYYDYICSLGASDSGYTNIYLINGQQWTVKESKEEIIKRIKHAYLTKEEWKNGDTQRLS